MHTKNLDTFKTKETLKVGKKSYTIFNLKRLEKKGLNVSRLPYSLKILLENLLRHEDGQSVSAKDIEKLAKWNPTEKPSNEISFTPARVILQDFTGVPAAADLAAMRDAMASMGGDPKKINPLLPAELVIDHSVQIDSFGSVKSFDINVEKEFKRNQERYTFLRWGQNAFDNFRVVPPDTGIIHQINLEYLARVIFAKPLDCHPERKRSLPAGKAGIQMQPLDSSPSAQNDSTTYLAYPDTLVGTDSHTTMINGLGVLGWGVGGIEAEAAMLGQPIPLLIPQVIGFKLSGRLPEGATSTDLVLTATEMLRQKGVVGKFVEFFGPGLSSLSLADRATLSNMSPEFGSTCGIFPIDAETINYLKFTGRPKEQIDLVEAYAKATGLFHLSDPSDRSDLSDASYTDVVKLDLTSVIPSLAGPKRPQDRVILTEAKEKFKKALPQILTNKKSKDSVSTTIDGKQINLSNGSVVIASITSCTNTSNPSVLIGAGLLAKKAVEKGLQAKPWVKTSLAPGSKVVNEYLKEAGLLSYLEKLKFHIVGYGCATCIGNSGPLPEPISNAIQEGNLVAVSVLSGNRNFEGRINPHVRANYLASPPLVVAYALSGKMDWDPYKEPIGKDKNGKDVFLKDIWPSQEEIRDTVKCSVKSKMFEEQYGQVFDGDKNWQKLPVPKGDIYTWDSKSTYIQQPPFFSNMKQKPDPLNDIKGARALAVLGDSVTTDHISPAGSIAKDSPAGKYLVGNSVDVKDFNSYGSRRGNHEVMMRGTFANIRLRNQLAPGTEGGVTRHLPDGKQTTIYDASLQYQKDRILLIVIGGKEYGSGSSRDWAAKGTRMLGIKAVIAESFERIHRSNLIGMGVLPLQFQAGENRQSLKLTGEEEFTISGIAKDLAPGKKLKITAKNGSSEKTFEVTARIDTPVELEYYRHGGILQYVLRHLM